MATANSIITRALRIAGVLARSEPPDAEELNDGLDTLNDLMESMSNDSLLLYARTLENFTLTGGQTDYTIGSGGDFDTDRPLSIIKAYVRSGDIDYPLSIISDEEYANITLKTTQTIPYFLNYNGQFPLGTIKLYPSPPSGYELYILSEKVLATFTLNQTVQLPPGWNRFLKNRLALELAPEYGVQISQMAYEASQEALGMIKRTSAKVKSMDHAPMTDNGNVFSGWEN